MMARLTLFVCVSLGVLPAGASAQFHDERLDQYAWACSGSYSPYPLNVLNGKNRETAICIGEGKRKPILRSEAFNRCRKQFSASSLRVSWTRNGWYCRHNGH